MERSTCFSIFIPETAPTQGGHGTANLNSAMSPIRCARSSRDADRIEAPISMAAAPVRPPMFLGASRPKFFASSVIRRGVSEFRRRLELVLVRVHFGAPFSIVGVIGESDRGGLHRHATFSDTDDVGFDVAVFERDVFYRANILVGRVVDIYADRARNQRVAGKDLSEFAV